MRLPCCPLRFLLLLAVPTAFALRGDPAPQASATAVESTVQLDPFEVQADSDKSYGALNSRSITAFNVALDHIPVSADIFDQAFMVDVGATSVEGLIQNYSAGAGASALSAGATAFQSQPGDRVNLSYPQLRGLMTPNMQRDSLLYMGTLGGPGGTSIGQTSNFDLERVELIDGPQALMYDGGGGGGVINVVSKEARLGVPAFGTFSFRTDQWGTKYALLDYGASAGHLAARVAVVDATNKTRRFNVGDHLAGTYVQFAGNFGNTVVRLSLEQTRDARVNSTYVTLTAAGDPTYAKVAGSSLGYMLASGAGPTIDNGNLNWSNVNSFEGNLNGDTTVAGFASLSVDTRWTDWLTTRLQAGISEFVDDHFMDVGAVTMYTPQATANPLPGHWTMGMTGAFSASDGVRPYHGQGLRYGGVITNDLFGGKAKSQTNIGADLVDNRGGIIEYAYYQADSNWNILTSGPAGTNLGRLVLAKQYWPVDSGPVSYPLFRLGSPRISINGVNYVRAQENPFVPSQVTPQNPLGASLVNGPNGLRNDAINNGLYLVNYTQWLDGKLDTLAGVRLEHAYTYTARPQHNPPSLSPVEIIDSRNFNFDVGADYHVLPWLAPYFSFSQSYLVPPDLQNDPNGAALPVSQALAEEVGIKVATSGGRLSGSVAVYHSAAKNEEFLMTSTLENDINPSGLNGVYDSDSTNAYAADVKSKGVQLTMTANPTPNWRMRLSAAYAAGTLESTRIYSQLYNDQFYTSGGTVTYADGTPVYVAPTFNAKTPAYTQANAPAGSVPLTVTMLSTPGGTYYAYPQPVTGAVLATSSAAKVLQSVDTTHGAILTGVTGLPISAYQLNTGLTGVPLAGQIPAAVAGESTTGYPEYSANLTSMYAFERGLLKGFEIGGTAILGWRTASYYYYANGLGTAGPLSGRSAFFAPTTDRFDLIVGYSRKIGRFKFTSRLNVYNLFNRYSVLVYPDLVNGWTNPTTINANFSQQPRSFVWTNTVGF